MVKNKKRETSGKFSSWCKRNESLAIILTSVGVLIFTIILTAINVYLYSSSSEMLNETKTTLTEMKNLTKEMENVSSNTSMLMKWSYEPRPQITILNNSKDIIENGTIPIKMLWDYNPHESNSIIKYAPLMLREKKRIVLQIYNSGRLPWLNPIMYLNLTAENTSKMFPFRFYEIITPVDGIYVYVNLTSIDGNYQINPDNTELRQFYLSEWPVHKINYLPYWHWNEYNSLDLPPRYSNGHTYYRNLISRYEIEAEGNKKFNGEIPVIFDTMTDKFGPFRIGDIQPESAVEIHIDLISAIENYSEVIQEYSWPFQNTFTTGKLTIEFEALNGNIDPISFSLSATFN
jgi:hypothetical protein